MRFKTTIYDTALIILVGLPASGKSTYAKEMVKDNPIKAQWISSDNIRIEHDYNISNDKVFQKMWERTKAAALGKKYIIYDATNLSAKRRHLLVNQFGHFCKKNHLTYTVEAVVFLQPINELYKRNMKRIGRECVPNYVISRMLRQFQFPAYWEGFNDIIISDGSQGAELPFKEILEMGQDNPHHTLSLGSHLWKTNMEAMDEDHRDRTTLIAAMYHDVGKYWTKEFDKKGVAHYYNHENVGAYMTALHFLKRDRFNDASMGDICYDAIITINYHMRPYVWEKSEKAKEKDEHNFSITLIERLKRLNKYDRAAH